MALIVAVAIVSATAFYFFTNKNSPDPLQSYINEPESENQLIKTCGDGICGIDEGCDTCSQDCGCSKGETCSQSNGVCYGREVCGDGACTAIEKSSNSCCSDCSCAGEEVCNKYLESCQDVFEISESQLSEVRKKYPYYNLTAVQNGFYHQFPAKILSFDCTKESFAPCGVQVTLLENGSVVTEDRVTHTTN